MRRSHPVRITRHFLFGLAQQYDTRALFLAEDPREAGVETGGDSVQHQNGGGLGPAFHGGQHAAADARPPAELIEREPTAKPLLADPAAENGQGKVGMCPNHSSIVYKFPL